MKKTTLSLLLLSTLPLLADGAFYGDPPDATHPWGIHDVNRPKPLVVAPGTSSTPEVPGKPPADAVVLFDGTPATLGNWVADKGDGSEPTKWVVKDGALQCVPGAGYVRTKEQFGDCQLHVEWSAPSKVEGNSQGRGNSGVFLMGQVEVQVLDNYNNPSYADGYAASVYGVNPPMINALRPPGEWQSYDIVFRRPVYKDGKAVDPGYVTVFVNGVLVQDHTPLEGGTGHRGRTKPGPLAEKGPLKLQDHGNPVRFRNIWCRPLPARVSQGGTDGGLLTEAAATAKKQEIAAEIRSSSAKLRGKEKMLRLMESLCYAQDDNATKESGEMLATWAGEVKAIAKDKLESKKGEILQVTSALRYLEKFKLATFAQKADLETIVKEQAWEDKKK